MEFNFLKERLGRFLAIIPESYKIADEIKKSPKGLSVVLERDAGGKIAEKGAKSGEKKMPEKARVPAAIGPQSA